VAGEGGVAAVQRALKILDAFTENDDKLPLAELSKRTGLYKSTLLRLAKSLENFGYLVRSDDGTYRLGSKLLHLGSLYQRHFRTSELVPPVLRDMMEELHEGASFYVRDGEQRVCLHRVEASRAVRDSVHEGDRLQLTVGAGGHVILAFGGQSGERYEQVRRDMYCASYGERDPETAAVACPVFGLNQRFVGALSVSGPRYRIEALGVKRIVPVLFKYARRLTQILGGDPDRPEFAGWSRPLPGARAARPTAARKQAAARKRGARHADSVSS
jgi:DNA-binding IclR family transcriptional regulator